MTSKTYRFCTFLPTWFVIAEHNLHGAIHSLWRFWEPLPPYLSSRRMRSSWEQTGWALIIRSVISENPRFRTVRSEWCEAAEYNTSQDYQTLSDLRKSLTRVLRWKWSKITESNPTNSSSFVMWSITVIAAVPFVQNVTKHPNRTLFRPISSLWHLWALMSSYLSFSTMRNNRTPTS